MSQVPFTPPRGWVPPGTPAWQSVPKPVRFAVWVWAVMVIAGAVGAALLLLLVIVGANLAVWS